jgi:cysteine synthase
MLHKHLLLLKFPLKCLLLEQGADASEGMTGAIKKAKELIAQTDNAFMPQQFENPINPDIHRKTTAQEIWSATDGNIDAFVCGVVLIIPLIFLLR